MSQVWVPVSFDPKSDVCANIDVLRGVSGGGSCTVATMMMFLGCLAGCAGAAGAGDAGGTVC